MLSLTTINLAKLQRFPSILAKTTVLEVKVLLSEEKNISLILTSYSVDSAAITAAGTVLVLLSAQSAIAILTASGISSKFIQTNASDTHSSCQCHGTVWIPFLVLCALVSGCHRQVLSSVWHQDRAKVPDC